MLDFLDQFKVPNLNQDHFLLIYYKTRSNKFDIANTIQHEFMKDINKSEINLLDKFAKFLAKLFYKLPGP